MKYLITGGAGFIGGNFCHYMVNKYPKDNFICLDALTYAGNIKTIDFLITKPNFTFIHGNICDVKLVEKLYAEHEFDYVINFAAESHVDRSIDNSLVFFESNVLGTQVLMDACRKFGVTRYHQVSTDEVYGDLALDEEGKSFDEETGVKPSNPYSASKASADLLVMAYYRTYGLAVTISRSSNNYGPYQHQEKLIPLIISKAMNNEKLPIYGDGKNIRDWVHVYDHCHAIDLIVKLGQPGEIYNVSGREEKSNLFVVETILSELNKSTNLITFVTDRLGHDLKYSINSSKIELKLGWKPNYNFKDGINETIKWYIKNQDWMKSD